MEYDEKVSIYLDDRVDDRLFGRWLCRCIGKERFDLEPSVEKLRLRLNVLLSFRGTFRSVGRRKFVRSSKKKINLDETNDLGKIVSSLKNQFIFTRSLTIIVTRERAVITRD